MSTPPPVKYVLYSHYGAHEGEDFKVYQAEKQKTDFGKLKGVVHLQRHFGGLRELLNSPGHGGLLVLFYAPDKSLQQLLDQLRVRIPQRDRQTDREPDDSLRFADEMAKYVREQLANSGLADRVRFITPSDLLVLLGNVDAIWAAHFQGDIVGLAQGIRYDTPKVVEAIIRLRLLGNGVPVLRLDHDVLFRFREDEKVFADLGLFKAVACAVQAHRLRLAQPNVSTFLFSASYDYKALLDPAQLQRDPFEAWSRAFATRIYPALRADPECIKRICGMAAAEQQKEWNNYVASHLDEDLARQFYGLTNNRNELETTAAEGLASIGAHPLYAVISGALLCLSEGAILDLPPFSNFRNNVMWIDDHLKYSLHRAMHHFTSDEPLRLEEPGLSNARFDDVSVIKARPSVGNLPGYIFGIYLPTLLWGSIMDAWISSDSILKVRMGTLDSDTQYRWREAKMQQDRAPQAPLPQAMLRALSRGEFLGFDDIELGNALEDVAIERIEKVRQLWAKLRNESGETFASYWAQGTVKEVFGEECFSGIKHSLWEGISGKPLDRPIASRRDISNPDILDKLRDLRDDAVAYVHWTLRWPTFVQIVRSIRQGDFMGDLGWKPKNTD